MFAEGVLVRILPRSRWLMLSIPCTQVRVLVPRIGEAAAVRLGLVSFALQCVCLAFATTPLVVFASMGLSMMSNLVYPSISR
jgi:hypothetical protein